MAYKALDKPERDQVIEDFDDKNKFWKIHL